MELKTPTIYIKSIGPEVVIDRLGSAVEQAVAEAMDKMAEDVEWEIRRKASGELNETRQAYLDGLSVLHHSGKITITVDGGLAVAVEAGSKPRDVSTGKVGQVGWYKGAPRHFRNITGKPTVTGKNWVHPGIKAHDFIGKVAEDLEDRIADDAFSEAIDRIQVK